VLADIAPEHSRWQVGRRAQGSVTRSISPPGGMAWRRPAVRNSSSQQAPRVQIEYDSADRAEKKDPAAVRDGLLADCRKPAEGCRGRGSKFSTSTSTLRQPHEGPEASRGISGARHTHGRGNLSVELTFTAWTTSPRAVAFKVDALKQALNAQQLSTDHLHDGRGGGRTGGQAAWQDPALCRHGRDHRTPRAKRP